MRFFAPLVAAAVLMAGSAIISLAAPRSRAAPSKPNVVVILVDTLRPGYLGLYGYDEETAPFLARLSTSSALFERAMATSSWTAPATASVFTSLYPHQHGVVQGFYAHRDGMFAEERRGVARIPLNAIAEGVTTLPELFRAAGYATFGVAANRNIDRELGFARGFDRFYEKNDVPAEHVYRKVRSWKGDIARSRPYFLYVHLMDPHYPYAEISPHFERYRSGTAAGDDEKARYLSEIRYTDHWIERMYKLLRMDRNTLLVLVSDHGEEFGDHGSTQHGPYLYDELQHVLLMVHDPRVSRRRIAANVSQVDILPTLAEGIGAAAPAQAQGRSLWPLLRGEQTGEEAAWSQRVLMAHRIIPAPPYYENWAALRGPWKYIEHHGRAAELYDLRTDPGETHSIAAERSDVAQPLSRAVEAARGAPREFRGRQVQVPIDPALQDQLKSLGYVN